MQIKSVIFDFGGTIDTNGIHWSEMFWKAYKECGVPVEKSNYEKAYVEAERAFRDVKNKVTLDFYGILKNRVFLQLEYLYYNKKFNKLPGMNKLVKYNECIADFCYSEVKKNIEDHKELFKILTQNYEMAVVSNFYGNIDKVLKEFNILKYFSQVVDSEVVGIRKPDPDIFKIGCELLKGTCKEMIVIGDSYTNDIEPSKSLGCNTIWLEGKSWTTPESTGKADYKIHKLKDIKKLLKIT